MPTEQTSVWLRPERGARGPASRWTRSQVAALAIRRADEEGIAAVTMRSLAQDLGTGPASLYRLVRSRQELLELMADEVIGEFTYASDLIGAGTRGLLELAHQARTIYLRHPWLIDQPSAGGALGPNGIAYLDHALATLQGVAATAQAKLETIAIVSALVRMLVAREWERERAGWSEGDWQAATEAHLAAQVTDGRYPHLAAVLAVSAAERGHHQDIFDRIVTHTSAGLLAAI